MRRAEAGQTTAFEKFINWIMYVVAATIGVLIIIAFFVTLWWFWPDFLTPNFSTLEDPNLYELTRQTAENTRHIFWLLVVGFVCLFGLLRKNKAT